MIQRCKNVQAWVEQALPRALVSERVMIEEVETSHVIVDDRFETHIHILASPPWSMKVMKRLEDVTEEKVKNVMTLAQLCGPCGIPSVR